MKTLGILGLGEVGRAIEKLAKRKFRVVARDVAMDQFRGNSIDILHICIPYSEDFIQIVCKTIQEVKPELVIIDSTIAIGTTRKIIKRTGSSVAHCPIMGVHPDLAKHQKIFTKVVGVEDKRMFKKVMLHWKKLGAGEVIKFDRPEESEAAKLLSTTYYAWNIVFNKIVKRMSNEKRINFDQVYTVFNKIYNEGYSKISPQVVRPVLKHVDGKIGGHCVIPNARILLDFYEEEWIKKIVDFNGTLGDEKESKE